MSPLLSTLPPEDLGEIAVVTGLVSLAVAWAFSLSRVKSSDLRRLEQRLETLQYQVTQLLQHTGLQVTSQPPSGMSPEVERLACDPSTKIAAIKLYRDQHPGVGLAEAKAKIEAFANSRT